jgi:hypothetical protein
MTHEIWQIQKARLVDEIDELSGREAEYSRHTRQKRLPLSMTIFDGRTIRLWFTSPSRARAFVFEY